MKNRDKWQKEQYSRFWVDQVLKYGFDDYCKGLCKLIEAKHPKTVYELAIGTGWPFAATFYEDNIHVAGSDISDVLVNNIQERYPGIDARVASYDTIVPAELYDAVYCFRSTWYFPDIFKAIDTMSGLTKKDGWMLFDIMNADSAYIKKIVRNHRISFPLIFGKNILKRTANFLFGRHYLIQNLWNIDEIPASEAAVEQHLTGKGIVFKKYSINQIIQPSTNFDRAGKNDSKIVFECKL